MHTLVKKMKVAVLAPISWRTPPRHYGPWEWVVSQLTEGLVRRGVAVTLFATGDSVNAATLRWIAPRSYSEDPELDPKVWECLHIAAAFEKAHHYDLFHNHFDFLPLSYSALVNTPVLTTIHGFSSPRILPVYRRYNGRVEYVAISAADRHPDLDYRAVVHHGIPVEQYPVRLEPGHYLLFFGRIHPDKGAHEAVQLAQRVGQPLILAGIVQDQAYFDRFIAPFIDGCRVRFLGPVGPPEKGLLLSGARALLHLINFDEPFGLSVIEAMACGTPVIAMRRGSMAELIREGETGFLVDNLSDAAARVKDLDSINRGRCREWVEERFTVERMVDAYLEVYRAIIYERSG